MGHRRILSVVLVGGLLVLAASGCGGSSKKDTSSDSGGGVTTAVASKGTPVAVDVGENADGSYYMKVDPSSVSAGSTTFTMKNSGTKEHEMVVLKTDTAADQLTVSGDRVSEKDSVGEISETAAGKTVSKTLDLKAGSYVLVCNIAKHYGKGMYAAFTVS